VVPIKILIREAEPGDLEAIVRLHEADALGGHGDAWNEANEPRYRAAFQAIQASNANALYVAIEDGVAGTFQLTIIPGLVGRGRTRAKLESVQVRVDQRSQGIGAAMVAFAEACARELGAETLELTSNKTRTDAHRFYERLGYAQSHAGFKKVL
jgi:GNAT superfamily N-acetyltransferase